MSIRRRFALILAILWLWPGSLYAQSEALMEAYRRGQTLYEAGRYHRESAVRNHPRPRFDSDLISDL